jgi:hypothetical protein
MRKRDAGALLVFGQVGQQIGRVPVALVGQASQNRQVTQLAGQFDELGAIRSPLSARSCSSDKDSLMPAG